MTHEELRKLAEAATPGSWCVEYGEGNEHRFVYIQAHQEPTPIAFIDDFLEKDGWTLDPKDLNFIAATNPTNILSLLDEMKADKERIAALREALIQIRDIKERKKNCYPPDWREQIAACPECQRYKGHPIQQGICDDHRRPIYEQQDHDAHETKILGYRAMQIARDTLEGRAATVLGETNDY